MMEKTTHFKPVIDRWPTQAALAGDIGASLGQVSQWLVNDSIPAGWFAPIERAAKVRGFNDITAAYLAYLAELRRLDRPHTRRARAGAAA